MVLLTALMGFLLFSGPILPQTKPTGPQEETSKNFVVTVTAYNAVPEQTDNTPHETASGAFSNSELIVARSRNLADTLPFGTIIEFDASNTSSWESCGYHVVEPVVGYRVIADTMNARYTDRVDILFGTKKEYVADDGATKNAAEVLGVCSGITVRVVGFVDIRKMPSSQKELVAIVEGRGKSLSLK